MHLLTVSNTQGQPEHAPLTLYDLLGALPDDDAEGLKNAFRKAAKANHPDLHPGDPGATERLSGIVRAYAILRDPQERASYDRALEFEREQLEFEREQLRPQPRRSLFDRMYNIASEAAVIAVLAVALGGGYALLAGAYKASVGAVKVVEANTPGPVKIATAQPEPRTGATGRDAPRDVLEDAEVPDIAGAPSVVASTPSVVASTPSVAASTPSIAASTPSVAVSTPNVIASKPSIVESTPSVVVSTPSVVASNVAAPTPSVDASTPSVVASTENSDHAKGIDNNPPVASLPERDIEGTKVINGSGAPADRADAKASADQPKKSHGVEPLDQNQNPARSADVELSSLEKDKSVTKSSSPDIAISEQKRHITTPATHGKPRAIRQASSHAPFNQAALENRSTSACSEAQSCPGKTPPLLGVGF